MDSMEASYVIYVNVGTFNQREQHKICIITVSSVGIAILSVQHYMMLMISFMKDSRDIWRRTSLDIVWLKKYLSVTHTDEILTVVHLYILV